MCVWSKPGGYHFTFFILFSLVCQNAVCKFCTCRQSFRYCSFIPQLKKVHLFASPPNLQKYSENFSSAFSEHFFIVLSPSTISLPAVSGIHSINSFMYVEFPLICLMPLIRWTHPLSLQSLPCLCMLPKPNPPCRIQTTTSSKCPRTKAYKSRITDAKMRLVGLERSLARATPDKVSDNKHAAEMSRAKQEMHELRMLEATALLEEARFWIKSLTGADRGGRKPNEYPKEHAGGDGQEKKR